MLNRKCKKMLPLNRRNFSTMILSTIAFIVITISSTSLNSAEAFSIGPHISKQKQGSLTGSQLNDLFGQQQASSLSAQLGVEPASSSYNNDNNSNNIQRPVINENHATYVEPPANFKPIIYEPERQSSASVEQSSRNNADLESLESPNQLLSLAQTQHSVSVQNPGQRQWSSGLADSFDRRQAETQSRQQANGGEKIQSLATSLSDDNNNNAEDEGSQSALKPSIGRWSDWTDMSIEPDLASSDSQVSATAAFQFQPSSQPSLKTRYRVGAQPVFLFHGATVMHQPQPQQQQVQITTPHLHYHHHHQVQNLYQRQYPLINGYQPQQQQQQAIRFAQMANNEEALERRLMASNHHQQQHQQQHQRQQQQQVAAMKILSLNSLMPQQQQPALTLSNNLINVHPSYGGQTRLISMPAEPVFMLNHYSNPAAFVGPSIAATSGSDQQRSQRPLKRSRKSKSTIGNEEIRAQLHPASLRLPMRPMSATLPWPQAGQMQSHQPLISVNQHEQVRVFSPGQQQPISTRAAAKPMPPSGISSLADNTKQTNVSATSSAAAQQTTPVKRILKRRRIKSQLPVGLSSWFLGGIRDLDGRHWHLPQDVVSKLTVNDVDLQHESQSQEVGAGVQPGDTMSHSQVETQGPPLAQQQPASRALNGLAGGRQDPRRK